MLDNGLAYTMKTMQSCTLVLMKELMLETELTTGTIKVLGQKHILVTMLKHTLANTQDSLQELEHLLVSMLNNIQEYF